MIFGKIHASVKLAPLAFDLIAYYEPRADFALSAKVRRSLDELRRRYSRATWMTGKHSGGPVLHTDIKGISIGTRIEVSRLVLHSDAHAKVLTDTFRLFTEAVERRITSGPIRRITIHYHKSHRRPGPRAAAKQAFRAVFGRDCCFLARKKKPFEIGHAVVHQTLLEHLFESGAYHSTHQPRIEAVTNELQKQPGRYENHHFFVMPVARPEKVPRVRFCYSGQEPDPLVETAMRQKTEEHLLYVSPDELAECSKSYVSLSDYERASRRYGTLWVLQDDLIRALDRHRASIIFLFLDQTNRPPRGWITWDHLYDRQQHCPYISRASRQSPSFLELSLEHLVESDFLIRDKDRYALNPCFANYQHATFYELGKFDKRFT